MFAPKTTSIELPPGASQRYFKLEVVHKSLMSAVPLRLYQLFLVLGFVWPSTIIADVIKGSLRVSEIMYNPIGGGWF